MFLTGCGSKTDDTSIAQTLASAIKARKEAKKSEGQPKPPPQELTREAIAHIDKPLLQIDAQAAGFRTLYAQVAQNGPYRTYLNNAKMSVTFNAGMITATRGFGFDLLSQGISIPISELFAETNAPKTYKRTQQQLAKIRQVAEIDYTCTLTKGDVETITIVEIDYSVLRYSETCRNSDRAFKNVYWVDEKTRRIWKSLQSIGQQAGFFVTEVLVQP
jgi:hypothetical protein